jgi:hypothetical protein
MVMYNFISKLTLIMVLMLVTQRINAQSFNDYRDMEAVMLQVNGNVYSQTKLEGAFIALPNYSNQLILRLHIPYSLINENAPEDTATLAQDYLFNLKIRIDSWKIQETLTSGKSFDKDGYLTLNHITKLVLVEYNPLPSLSVQDGSFNLNLIAGFNPVDFNLDIPNADTRYFIKIGDAPVNRL